MTASTLTADNGASSGTSGIKYNGGTDGTLQIQTTTSGGTDTFDAGSVNILYEG